MDLAYLLSDFAKKNHADITFVGHSLGGGLAALAAMVTDGYADTYNAASVSEMTMGNNNIDIKKVDQDKINAVIIENEPLSFFQKHIHGLGQAQGTKVWLNENNLYDLIPVIPSNHSIDQVIKLLKRREDDEL